MKIPIPVVCPYCGCDFSSLGYGEKRIPPAHCPACGKTILILDPLSISVVADRLLFRSRSEVDSGDPTVSIICSAVAVEAALTQVFVKWKKMDHWVVKPTAAQQNRWENEYRNGTRQDKSKRSGFEKSADLVSHYLTGKMFDDFVGAFVKKNGTAALIGSGSPRQESELKASHVHKKLFHKRNRIMHWGEVNFEKDDALNAFTAACDAISILKLMDQERLKLWSVRFESNPTSNSP
jgi:hypothetical protein